MKNKKKLFAIIIAASISFSLLCGCGNSNTAAPENNASIETQALNAKADTGKKDTKTVKPGDKDKNKDTSKKVETTTSKTEDSKNTNNKNTNKNTNKTTGSSETKATSSSTGQQASKPAQTSTTTSKPSSQTATPITPSKPSAPSTSQQEQKSAGCSHNWVPITEVVHHDAVTHQEWVVDQEARREVNVVYRTRCLTCWATDCGYSHTCEGGADVCEFEDPQVTWYPESGHYETIIDSNAYDETITTGYKCNKCGALK